MNLNLMSSAGRVRRFHNAEMFHQQTVAEHSWGVAMVILTLHNEGGLEPAVDLERVLKKALTHDITERLTGDIVGYLKTRPVKSIVQELEFEAMDAMEVEPIITSSEEDRVLKFADILEGIVFCNREIAMGNQFACRVRDRFIHAMIELQKNTRRNSVMENDLVMNNSLDGWGIVDAVEGPVDAFIENIHK